MHATKDALVSALLASIEAAKQSEWPYRSWVVRNCLPSETMGELWRSRLRHRA